VSLNLVNIAKLHLFLPEFLTFSHVVNISSEENFDIRSTSFARQKWITTKLQMFQSIWYTDWQTLWTDFNVSVQTFSTNSSRGKEKVCIVVRNKDDLSEQTPRDLLSQLFYVEFYSSLFFFPRYYLHVSFCF